MEPYGVFSNKPSRSDVCFAWYMTFPGFLLFCL
uniref:Uncharacterized protein n=1 Tax=Anguilla anguilla TaxID=7936 RepID=A0A0E9QT92_ANGAN